MEDKMTVLVLSVIILVVQAFLFMLIWNHLIASDIGLNTISFGGAIGVSLVATLFSGFHYSDTKAVADDMTTAIFYQTYLNVEFFKIIIILVVGVVVYFFLT